MDKKPLRLSLWKCLRKWKKSKSLVAQPQKAMTRISLVNVIQTLTAMVEIAFLSVLVVEKKILTRNNPDVTSAQIGQVFSSLRTKGLNVMQSGGFTHDKPPLSFITHSLDNLSKLCYPTIQGFSLKGGIADLPHSTVLKTLSFCPYSQIWDSLKFKCGIV